MPKDVDAVALWDAKARTLIGRIDAALAIDPPAPLTTAPAGEDPDPRLTALARRAMTRTPPPPGEILTLVPPNMGPGLDRIDPWDAYVCRFDDDTGENEPLRATP